MDGATDAGGLLLADLDDDFFVGVLGGP